MFRKQAPAITALLLKPDCKAAVTPEPQGSSYNPDGVNEYVLERGRVHWIPESIPAGWLYIHSEGNPEPITNVPPRGYGSRLLAYLVGNWLSYILGRANDEPEDGNWLNDWRIWAIGGAVVLGVVAALLYARAHGMI